MRGRCSAFVVPLNSSQAWTVRRAAVFWSTSLLHHSRPRSGVEINHCLMLYPRVQRCIDRPDVYQKSSPARYTVFTPSRAPFLLKLEVEITLVHSIYKLSLIACVRGMVRYSPTASSLRRKSVRKPPQSRQKPNNSDNASWGLLTAATTLYVHMGVDRAYNSAPHRIWPCRGTRNPSSA